MSSDLKAGRDSSARATQFLAYFVAHQAVTVFDLSSNTIFVFASFTGGLLLSNCFVDELDE